MAKPEWGQKRTCQSCGCRFYDLTRTPLVCPKCGANVEPEVTFKVRRGGSAPVEPKVVAPVVIDLAIAEIEADELIVADDDEEVLVADDDNAAEDDESGLIEDASDLGEDDDDMAEVMEHMDDVAEDEV